MSDTHPSRALHAHGAAWCFIKGGVEMGTCKGCSALRQIHSLTLAEPQQLTEGDCQVGLWQACPTEQKPISCSCLRLGARTFLYIFVCHAVCDVLIR